MGYAQSIERVIFMTVYGQTLLALKKPTASTAVGCVYVRPNGFRLNILLLICP